MALKALAAAKPIALKRYRAEDLASGIDRLAHSPVFQKKPVFWALAVLGTYFFFMQTLPFIPAWDTDSPSYYTAARGLRQSINIFDDREFQPLADSLFGRGLVVFPYIYPPLLAQLALPLAGLSQSAYFRFFYIFNILLTLLALYLLIEFLDLWKRRTILPAVFPFALLIFCEPVFTTIHHGQVNLLVLDAILLFLIFQKKGKPVPAAFFLSLAVFIKIYPVLFVLTFFYSKRLKYLGAFAATSAALLAGSVGLSGWRPWRDFIRSTLDLFLRKPDSPFTQGFQNSFGNVSLKGFLTQAAARFGLPESAVTPVFAVLAGALVISIFVYLKRRSRPADLGFESALVFVLTLVLAPITWSHHYVLILFPLVYLFDAIVRERRYAAFLPLAFLAGVILYELPWGAFPYSQIRLLGTLGILGMLFVMARKSVKTAAPAEA